MKKEFLLSGLALAAILLGLAPVRESYAANDSYLDEYLEEEKERNSDSSAEAQNAELLSADDQRVPVRAEESCKIRVVNLRDNGNLSVKIGQNKEEYLKFLGYTEYYGTPCEATSVKIGRSDVWNGKLPSEGSFTVIYDASGKFETVRDQEVLNPQKAIVVLNNHNIETPLSLAAKSGGKDTEIVSSVGIGKSGQREVNGGLKVSFAILEGTARRLDLDDVFLRKESVIHFFAAKDRTGKIRGVAVPQLYKR